MKIKNKRGFTLVECMVALVIFALMTAVVSGILSVALKQYKSNNETQENLNLQEKDLAEENSNIEKKNTIDKISIDFGDSLIEVENVDNMASKNQSGMQLNKLEATIDKEVDDGSGGGSDPIPDDIKTTKPHLYGTKGLESIYIIATVPTFAGGNDDTVTITMKITDSADGFFMSSRANSIKLVLPEGAYNVEKNISDATFGWSWSSNDPRWDYTNDDYDEFDTDKGSTNIRFGMCAGKDITIKFKISQDNYTNNFGSVYKYFYDKDAADANTVLLNDVDKKGSKTGYYAYSKV